jgi:DNA-binding NarL/FixJ family response regulator
MDLLDNKIHYVQDDQGKIAPSPKEARNFIKVLLVDDNDEFLSSLKRFLSHLNNIEITRIAHTGKDALAAVEQEPADLVLMDILMEPMSGFEATHTMKMKSISPKVIILSFYDSPEFQSLASLAHADGFVSKSKLGTDLFPMIQQLFPSNTGIIVKVT